LVLVNGRRMIASGTGASSTVDLNAIPFSAVKRIEVLKDGASGCKRVRHVLVTKQQRQYDFLNQILIDFQ